LGDPTGSNATTGLALRVTGTHKPLNYGKVRYHWRQATTHPSFYLTNHLSFSHWCSAMQVGNLLELATSTQ